MTLAVSAFLAIKMAVRSAREDAGLSTTFRLDSPATMDKILAACCGFSSKVATTVCLLFT